MNAHTNANNGRRWSCLPSKYGLRMKNKFGKNNKLLEIRPKKKQFSENLTDFSQFLPPFEESLVIKVSSFSTPLNPPYQTVISFTPLSYV
jgi:hypothetical protein